MFPRLRVGGSTSSPSNWETLPVNPRMWCDSYSEVLLQLRILRPVVKQYDPGYDSAAARDGPIRCKNHGITERGDHNPRKGVAKAGPFPAGHTAGDSFL
jgi:hypothetical protein